MHRNSAIFNNPSTFWPSRWENPTAEMKNAFQPFSLGGQNCIGQALAQAEIHAIIARICSEFELSVEGEGTTGSEITIEELAEVRLKARKV